MALTGLSRSNLPDAFTRIVAQLADGIVSEGEGQSEYAEEAEKLGGNLSQYIEAAWPLVEPSTEYIPNWHIDAMADHLSAVSRGEIQNLIINVPPRCMKSITVAVMWPTWEWTTSPWERFLFSTYGSDLTIRDSMKRRRIVTSPWYRARWGHVFSLDRSQSSKKRFDNDQTGFSLASSVGGATTGEGGSRLVVDDPLKADEGYSDAARNAVNLWWRTTMSTRLNDPKTGARVIIMQRLHEDDLVGYLLERMGVGGTHYEHLMLPMEYEPKRQCVTSLPYRDPRTKAGDLLWEARYDRGEVEVLKKDLGEYNAAAQLQQNPAPSGGGMFKERWWRYWVPWGQLDNYPPVPIVSANGGIDYAVIEECPPIHKMILSQSWDCAFKDKKDSDWVVGQAWGRKDAQFFLLAQLRGQWGILKTVEAILRLTEMYPEAVEKLIEDKANGPAVISMLQKKVAGLIAVNPDKSKEARAAAAVPMVNAGNVYLPHPQIAPWVEGFIHEFSMFPAGKNDDQVDAFTQMAQHYLERQANSKPMRARRVA